MGRFPVLIADQCDVSRAGAKATCVGNAGAYCVHKEGLSSKTVSENRQSRCSAAITHPKREELRWRTRRGILPSERAGLTINW